MSPPVKVIYFNSRGVAECMRMLLKYGGIEFEDVRFESAVSEEWNKFKPSVRFGQLPLYEEHGKTMNQSIAAARYVAKKVKLTGETDWENLEIDAIVDTLVDLRQKIFQSYFNSDEKLKEELRVVLVKETLPFYLDKLEKIAKENNEHLALSKLTWADVLFASSVETWNHACGVDILENRPYLKAVRDNFFAIPAINDWVVSRPVTVL